MAWRIVLSTGVLLALLAGSIRAGEPAAAPQPTAARTDRAALERRIADLEARVAELLKEVRALRAALPGVSSPAEEKPETRVFPLKYAEAPAVADLLGRVLKSSAGPRLRIAADPRTNCLVIQGTRDQIAEIAGLIERLDQPGRSSKDQGAQVTR